MLTFREVISGMGLFPPTPPRPNGRVLDETRHVSKYRVLLFERAVMGVTRGAVVTAVTRSRAAVKEVTPP